MKKIFFLSISLLALSSFVYSQCSVNIVPQGSTNLCARDTLVLNAVTTGGGTQLDQSSLLYNGGTSARTLPGYSIWQSFTAGITGTMTQVDLGFFNYINGTCTMKIFKGSGTYGPMLDIHQVSVNCPFGNCLLPFPLNIPVIAGQKYTVQIIPGTGMPDPYGVQIGSPGPYAAGKFAIVDPSGTDTSSNFDWVFRTWVGSNLGYLWSTGSAASNITVIAGGQYSVTVSDSAGCMDSDTIHIYDVPNPFVHLGHDTTICPSCSLTLNAGAGFTSYYWSTGQFSQSINVNVADTFWVEVTDTNGCTGRDSIIVQVGTVGLNEVKSGNTFIIKTDLEKGMIYVYPPSDMEEPYSASIFDMSGRQVYKQEFKGFVSIEMADLPIGMYLLKLESRQMSLNKKIPVIH